MVSVMYGSFHKDASFGSCLSIASGALSRRGYRVFEPADDRDYHVQASWDGHDVIVNVTCVPEGNNRTWIAVSAYSSDGAVAEQERNAIRDMISRVPSGGVLIDHGTELNPE